MEDIGVRRSLDTFVSGFGDADMSWEILWISRKDKKEGRSLHEKGIFQILVYLIQVIYAVELSLFWRFICEIYNSLNSLLRPHSSVTCPSSSRDRPPYTNGHSLIRTTALWLPPDPALTEVTWPMTEKKQGIVIIVAIRTS